MGNTDSGRTILLAEDEIAVRNLVRRVLEREGFQVLEAENGRVAVELAGSYPHQIDLFLTDVVMPELSGPRAAARIIAQRPGTSVLYMSGYAEGEVSESGELQPGIRLLEKPFSPSTLLKWVRESLA
jgi:two-component system, cell cycle sensor histidine kinase and response regulator CckA